MAHEDDERELLRRASQGDAPAVDELLQRHLPDLQAYVRRNISPSVLAKESSSDVVQSVCREVLQHVERFEYQGEAAFRAWLQQAALRKLIDRHRYYHAGKRDLARELGGQQSASLTSAEAALLASGLGSPSGDAQLHEEVARLEQAFSELVPADQAILRLIYVEGLSHAQAAERLGTSEVNSRKQLSRALARLSKRIV